MCDILSSPSLFFLLLLSLPPSLFYLYQVDVTQNHDACMQAFASAGIYLILDLANPTNSIDRNNPMYYLNMYNSMTATIDAFASYSNTLAFFAGNEVANSNTTTNASPFVKAMLRDAKAYIKNTKSRYIPVGYASNDDATIREYLLRYFNCGDPSEQVGCSSRQSCPKLTSATFTIFITLDACISRPGRFLWC